MKIKIFNVPENEKSPKGPFCIHSAERTLQSSNLKPLQELDINGIGLATSPHQIEGREAGTIKGNLLMDIAAINEFLFCLESEPFISPEKAVKRKRVPFKKAVVA